MSPRAVPDIMLTVPETARALRCGVTKVRELIKSGAIPSVRIGGLRRVRFTDLEDYVRNLPLATPKTQ